MKRKYIIFTLLTVITLAGVSGWYFWSKPQTKAVEPEMKPIVCAKREEFLPLINAERAKVGSPAVIEDPELMKIAQDRAVKLDGKMDNHEGFHQLVKERILPLKYLNFGENLAMGCKTPEFIHKWMISKVGHRETLLNKRFTHIGVGLYKDVAVTIYGEPK